MPRSRENLQNVPEEVRDQVASIQKFTLNPDQIRQIENFDYKAPPEYSEETHDAEITPTDVIWGQLTEEIYQGTETKRGYKRLPPFRRMRYGGGDRIEYYGKVKLREDQDPPAEKKEGDLEKYGVVPVIDVVWAKDLVEEARNIPDEYKKELLPKILRVIHAFKIIEDDVPYFVSGAKNMFKHVKGLSRGYGMWDMEETEHSEVLGFILEHLGGWQKEDMDKEYYQTQLKTWEAPFSKPLEIAAYARKQEKNTHGNYFALARALDAIGAKRSALMIRRIASDEQTHGNLYKDDVEAYASISPEHAVEAAEAVLRVAYHFRMPSQHLMRDRSRDIQNIVNVIGYNEEEVEQMIESCLNGYSFLEGVKDTVVPELVSSYTAAEKERVGPIFEKQIRDKVKSRKDASKNGEKNGSNGHNELVLPGGEIVVFTADGVHKVPSQN